MNIQNFISTLNNIVDEKKYIDININIGYINKQGVMNTNINKKVYDRFKYFILSKYKSTKNNIKTYYYQDLKLISYNSEKIEMACGSECHLDEFIKLLDSRIAHNVKQSCKITKWIYF